MSHVPPELFTEILPFLPVKSLLRFRCLSKSFCAQIDSPDFVRMRLKISKDTNTGRKLILPHRCGDDGPIDFYAADFEEGLKEVVRLENPLRPPTQYAGVCGSCDGLLLLGTGNPRISGEYVVWNPTTRRSRKLPLCPVTNLPPHKFLCDGLGYDSTIDDYKVVVVSLVPKKYSECFQVWVFSLRSNCWSWRRIHDLPTYVESIECWGGGCFANGALYWVFRVDGDFEIFGFDLANEMLFRLPDYCLSDDGSVERFSCYQLKELDGFVHTDNMDKFPDTQDFFLFNRDDIGTGGNWRRAFTFQQLWGWQNTLSVPLAYSKEGDCVLICTRNEVFWYNIEKKTRVMVQLSGMPPLGRGCRASYVCWESLVSPGNDTTFQLGGLELERRRTTVQVERFGIVEKTFLISVVMVLFLSVVIVPYRLDG
ncbi:hypothetical protein SLA2020_173440 [Shorea laevis]